MDPDEFRANMEQDSLDAKPETVVTVPQAEVAAATQSRRRLKLFKFNKPALLISLAAGVVIIALAFGSVTLINSRYSNQATEPAAKPDSKSAQEPGNYNVGKIPLGDVTPSGQLRVNDVDQVAINGELEVSNSLVLTPSSAPQSPKLGQLYFDSTTKQPYYYNGTNFVGLAPTTVNPQTLPAFVASLGGVTGNIGLGQGLQLLAGQLGLTDAVTQGLSGPRVTSLQGLTGDLTLTAGAGISISGTTISATGGGGSLNGSGTPGKIAKFTASGTLGDSLLAESGSDITASASFKIQPAANSSATFQVQNAAGTSNLLVANTVDNSVNLGTTSGYAQLNLQGQAAVDSGVITMTAANGSATFTTSAPITINPGDFIRPTGVSGENRYISTGGTTTSFTVSTAYTSNFGPVAFTISRPLGRFATPSGSNVLVVTNGVSNGRVGINTDAPTQALDVNGNANISSLLTVGSGSSSAFIGLNASSVGIINANNSLQALQLQTTSGDFYFKSNASHNTLEIDGPTGATTLRQISDSTTAFQLQNAAGTSNLLVADSLNTFIGIGKIPTTTLDVNGIISSSSQVQATTFGIESSSMTTGNISKRTVVGTGGVNANDVVILADDGGLTRAMQTTTARDRRVYGVANTSATAANSTTVVLAGNIQVNADTAAVSVGDQLVTSTTAGRVTVDNNATTGILGIALSAKAGGSNGLVAVAVNVRSGQYSPVFRSTSDSSSAFQVQNAAGTSVFRVNTTDGSISFGTSSSSLSTFSGFLQNGNAGIGSSYLQSNYHQTLATTGSAVTANEVLVYDSSGNVTQTSTARDSRIAGITKVSAANGAVTQLIDSGRATVLVDSGAVSIGDQLVTSVTPGYATVDNSATTGILGKAMSSKAGGSSGSVTAQVQLVSGQSTPIFRPNSDSTTAFQVQNAASTVTLLRADTSNSRLYLANAAVVDNATGSIWVGGTDLGAKLSVSTAGVGLRVNVTGTSSPLDLQLNGVSVASVDYQGNLTVKSATFNGHIITGNTSGSTTAVAHANAGTGASCSISGNDTAGQVTLTTGSGAWASGTQCTVTFSSTYSSAPKPVIAPANNMSVSSVQPFVDSSTSNFTIGFVAADSSANTYKFNYFNVQ